jgi:hypothetical protein
MTNWARENCDDCAALATTNWANHGHKKNAAEAAFFEGWADPVGPGFNLLTALHDHVVDRPAGGAGANGVVVGNCAETQADVLTGEFVERKGRTN